MGKKKKSKLSGDSASPPIEGEDWKDEETDDEDDWTDDDEHLIVKPAVAPNPPPKIETAKSANQPRNIDPASTAVAKPSIDGAAIGKGVSVTKVPGKMRKFITNV